MFQVITNFFKNQKRSPAKKAKIKLPYGAAKHTGLSVWENENRELIESGMKEIDSKSDGFLGEWSKVRAALWGALSEEEKAPYLEKATAYNAEGPPMELRREYVINL